MPGSGIRTGRISPCPGEHTQNARSSRTPSPPVPLPVNRNAPSTVSTRTPRHGGTVQPVHHVTAANLVTCARIVLSLAVPAVVVGGSQVVLAGVLGRGAAERLRGRPARQPERHRVGVRGPARHGGRRAAHPGAQRGGRRRRGLVGAVAGARPLRVRGRRRLPAHDCGRSHRPVPGARWWRRWSAPSWRWRPLGLLPGVAEVPVLAATSVLLAESFGREAVERWRASALPEARRLTLSGSRG